MTFMLSESVSRFIAVRYLDLSTLTVEADVVTGEPSSISELSSDSEPADYAGYADWSESLDTNPPFPPARYISNEEWLRIIGEGTDTPIDLTAPVHSTAPVTQAEVSQAQVSQTPVRPRKPFDQAGREERGRELARTAVICGAGSVYLCSGSDRTADPYTVDLATGTCSCPDMGRVLHAREQGIAARCKHQVAVETIVSGRSAA